MCHYVIDQLDIYKGSWGRKTNKQKHQICADTIVHILKTWVKTCNLLFYQGNKCCQNDIGWRHGVRESCCSTWLIDHICLGYCIYTNEMRVNCTSLALSGRLKNAQVFVWMTPRRSFFTWQSCCLSEFIRIFGPKVGKTGVFIFNVKITFIYCYSKWNRCLQCWC